MTDALRRIADTLDLQHALVEAAAVALANARGCELEEARARLTRQLEVVACVRDVARQEHQR